ncbi:SDR family oxidoreductase [Sodalis sp. RH24]|uniref:SDR family oxidoreductase n=1 Tax=unclassified Sodalis (in: enterobacteria) TaxID=2636512 RepID=UPI003965D12E
MNNQDILIIAAERGLGLGLAEQFFQRGWRLFVTAFPGADTTSLERIAVADPARLAIGYIDVTAREQIEELKTALGERKFDVIYLNAGIYGALHQSVLEATDEEMMQIMLTNTFGPARLARSLLSFLRERGTLAFMSSHRASIAGNVEGGLELYRASKAALNMLARGIYADQKARGVTVLSLHPGWAATAMGTLDGRVAAEIDVLTSVTGVADVVEHYRHSGQHLYLDYQGKPLPW